MNFDFQMPDMTAVRDAVARARDQAMRAGDEARRAARHLRVVTTDDDTTKTTRVDLGKATITFSDAQGELKMEKVDGRKMLTAKDAQGKVLFNGPIDTTEQRAKIPAGVRSRLEKLENQDLPEIPPTPEAPRAPDPDESARLPNPRFRAGGAIRLTSHRLDPERLFISLAISFRLGKPVAGFPVSDFTISCARAVAARDDARAKTVRAAAHRRQARRRGAIPTPLFVFAPTPFTRSAILSPIIGRQMLTIAIEWEVYARTHSATALGLVGLVAAVPIVALSLPAGHLADRFRRKSIILWTQAASAICSICLALVSWKHLNLRGWRFAAGE